MVQTQLNDDREAVFGPFHLLLRRRLLLKNGAPLQLGSRAFDLLVALLDKASEIISKDELNARVWPDSSVDEANLRVHMAAVRKALGDSGGRNRYITNIVGRGYSFIADVEWRRAGPGLVGVPIVKGRSYELPASLSRLIGRSAIVESTADRLKKHRLVTIVGAAGNGKTTVAIAVGASLRAHFQDDIRFIDFSLLSDPDEITKAVAASLDLPVVVDPLDEILGFLAKRRMLLLFDNCEHVIDAVSSIATQILRSTFDVHICATSREPLRVQGESVQRIPPLQTPPHVEGLTVEQALTFPSIALFLDRACSIQDSFEIHEGNVRIIANICRQMGGVPLAIELVSTQVDMLDMRELEQLTMARFLTLTNSFRTAQPRHRSLKAALEWSYGTLSPREQATLRRISVFRGAFTINGAAAVAGFDIKFEYVFEAIVGLATKSLLSIEESNDGVRYRLLDMTRVFANEKLEGVEATSASRAHLEYAVDCARIGEAELHVRTGADWTRVYGCTIDDIRAAIDWAFSNHGDESLGAELTAATAPLFFQLSLTDEFRLRVEHALHRQANAEIPNPKLDLRLANAICVAIYNLRGTPPELHAATRRALELADSLGPGLHQLPAIWSAIRERYLAGDYVRMMALIDRFGSLAKDNSDEEATFIHTRMLAFGLHLVGRHAEGRRCAERTITSPVRSQRVGYENLYQNDHGVMSRCHLARILWVQGLPDQATRLAKDAIEVAHSVESNILICSALTLAVLPIAFWTHDLTAVRKSISELLARSAGNSTRYWQFWARLYDGALSICENRAQTSFGNDGEFSALQTEILSTFHPSLAGPAANARAESGASAWNAAEVFRATGIRMLGNGDSCANQAESVLLKSLSLARSQEARSWQLRTATNLARLWRDRGRRVAARNVMESSLGHFTEGWTTGDLQTANAVLAEIS